VHHRAGAQRAEHRVEQAVCSFLVAGLEPTSGCGDEVALLVQVDANLVDLEELGDPLDRRLERVGKRQE